MRRGEVRIGCSGWLYDHWRGDFYAPELRQADWLTFYASRFDTVEINNSFYRLPERSTFAAWARATPEDFLFAVKASRFLTHLKKLKDPEAPLERLFDRLRGLGERLGPVLYQLPPRWKVNVERFRHFLEALPQGVRQVVEFRDPSWYVGEIRALLERHQVALCLHDKPGSTPKRERVGPFVYVRFHGSVGTPDDGYSTATLRRWATWLDAQRKDGVDVYAYFNNDVLAHAPRNAATLRRMLRGE